MAYTIVRTERKAQLTEGTYPAFCVRVEEAEKTFRDEEPKPGVKFWWVVVVEDEDKNELVVELPRHVTTTLGEKSNLTRDMSSVHGAKIWNAVAKDDLEIARIIDSTIGKDALLQVDVSKDGSWNNIKAVMPLPRGMYAPRPTQATTDTGSSSGSDDDNEFEF